MTSGNCRSKYEAAYEVIINAPTTGKTARTTRKKTQRGYDNDDEDPENGLDIPIHKDPEVLQSIDFSSAFDTTLPAFQKRNEFIDMLENNDVVIVNGPTGTGKSTQFPLYILAHAKEHNLPCHVLVTQPQRMATRAIALRVAQAHLKCRVGGEVGFQIGFIREVSDRTRLTYCTYGILSRILVAHRSLSEYTHVVLDEIHNRDSETDICTALALILKVNQLKKQQSNSSFAPVERTKIVIMSATLRQDDLRKYFMLPRQHYQISKPMANGGFFSSKEFNIDDDADGNDDNDDIIMEDATLINDNATIEGKFVLPPVIRIGKSEFDISEAYLDDYLWTGDHQRRQNVLRPDANGRWPALQAAHIKFNQFLLTRPQAATPGNTSRLGMNRPDTSNSQRAADGDLDDMVTDLYDSPWADEESAFDARFEYKPVLTNSMCHCIASLVFWLDDNKPPCPAAPPQYQPHLRPSSVAASQPSSRYNSNKNHDSDDAVALLTKNAESILIFLPGYDEICRVQEAIQARLVGRKLRIFVLHSMIEMNKMMKTLFRDVDDPDTRRVILSTNITESSVTIKHVKFVIDTCLTKVSAVDARGAFSLQTKWASQAQCDQRKGRVGRVQHGECYRMVPKSFYESLPQQLPSVLNNLPLEKIVLQLKQLESPTPILNIFETFLDPPEAWRVHRAVSECKDLGALEPARKLNVEEDGLTAQMEVLNIGAGRAGSSAAKNHDQSSKSAAPTEEESHVTPLGRFMSTMPCEPRIALIIVHAHALGILYEGIMLAAAACEPSVFRSTFAQRGGGGGDGGDMAAAASGGARGGGGANNAHHQQGWDVEARAADRELIKWTADSESDIIRVFNVLNHWRLMHRRQLGQPLRDTLVTKFHDQSGLVAQQKGVVGAGAREIASVKFNEFCESAYIERRRFETLVTTYDELIKRVTRAGFADFDKHGASVGGSSYHSDWILPQRALRQYRQIRQCNVRIQSLRQSNLEAESAELSLLLRMCIAGAYFPHVLVGRSAYSRYIRQKVSNVERHMKPRNWHGTHYNNMNVIQVHVHGDVGEQQSANTIALERPLMNCIDHIIAPQKINALQFAHECTMSEKVTRGTYNTIFIDLPSSRCTVPLPTVFGMKSGYSAGTGNNTACSHGSCSIIEAPRNLLSVPVRLALMRLRSTAHPTVNRDMLLIGNMVMREIRQFYREWYNKGFDDSAFILFRLTECLRTDAINGESKNVDLDQLVTRKRNATMANSKYDIGSRVQVRVTCVRDALNMYVLTESDYKELQARSIMIKSKWDSLYSTDTYDTHKQKPFFGTTGLWCVARNPESAKFERGRVLSNVTAPSSKRSTCNAGCSGRHWVLHFVDYGNTSVVCREQIKFVPLTDQDMYNWLTTESKVLATLLTLSNVQLTSMMNWSAHQRYTNGCRIEASGDVSAGGGGSAALVIRKLLNYHSPAGVRPTTFVGVVEWEPGRVGGELMIVPRDAPPINVNEKLMNDGYFEHCVQNICHRATDLQPPPVDGAGANGVAEHHQEDDKRQAQLATFDDNFEESFCSLTRTGIERRKRKIEWEKDRSVSKPTLAVDGVMQVSQRNLESIRPAEIEQVENSLKKPMIDAKPRQFAPATSSTAVTSRLEQDYEFRGLRVTSPYRLAWHSKHPLFELQHVVPTRDSVASLHLDAPVSKNSWPTETDEVVAVACNVFMTPPRCRQLPSKAFGGVSVKIEEPDSDSLTIAAPSKEAMSVVSGMNPNSTLVRLPLLKASSVTIMPRRTGMLSLLTLLYSPNVYLLANRSDEATTNFAGATSAFHCFTYNAAFATDARTIPCAFGKYSACDEALEAERLAQLSSNSVAADAEIEHHQEALRAMRSLMRVPFDCDITQDELESINEVRAMLNIVYESVGNRFMLRSALMRVLQAAIRRRILLLLSAKRNWTPPEKFDKWENRAYSDIITQTWNATSVNNNNNNNAVFANGMRSVAESDEGERSSSSRQKDVPMPQQESPSPQQPPPVYRRPHFVPINVPNNLRMRARIVRSMKARERKWDRVRYMRALKLFLDAPGSQQECCMAAFFYGDDAAHDPLFPVMCRVCRKWFDTMSALEYHLENTQIPTTIPTPYDENDCISLDGQPDRTTNAAAEAMTDEHSLLAAALRVYRDELTCVVCPYCYIVREEQQKDAGVYSANEQSPNEKVGKRLYTTTEVREHLFDEVLSPCARKARTEMDALSRKFGTYVNQHVKAAERHYSQDVWESDEDMDENC